MFCSRTCNNRINKIHERALRFVYNDYISTFDSLLERHHSFTIHHQNLQTLAIEIFKEVNGITKGNLGVDFCLKETFRNLRSNSELHIPSVRNVYSGKGSIRYFGPVLWNMIPFEIRNLSFNDFVSKIKEWKPDKCPCRICCNYIATVGFIELVE